MNKKLTYGILTAALTIIFFSFYFYKKIYGKAVIKEGKLYVKSNSSFKDLQAQLNDFIKNPNDFQLVAKLKKFSTPKGGMYFLKKGMSLNKLVNDLRSGNQTPIRVSFNNQDTLEKLAGRVSQQLEIDSISLLNSMIDNQFLSDNNFTKKSVLGIYIPNQYDFYWTDSADKFRNKMFKNYKRFWNVTRLDKAKKLGLSKNEVITLASIVQKETAQTSERPMVAGLYLNRLKNNWPLQADPTVIFAVKEKFGHHTVIKRVLNKDLTIDSPYNTYKNIGLPPTLIGMPDISSIEAVLNPAIHNYYYMCASTEKIGFHDFAKTLSQHNRNARKYQKWISSRGINR